MNAAFPTLFEAGARLAAPARQPEADAALPPVLQAGWQPEKQYYSIGEVARLFDLRASNIRFWTTEFKLKVRTNRKGDRLYTAAHIQTLRAIYFLVKEKGYTLGGAKAKLQETKAATDQVAGLPEEEGVPAQARPIIYTLELQQQLLSLRNRLVALRNSIS